ncbi:hypothetical protein H0H81_001800 [Sphagnurus paluster]|uniref:Uncharacterized protein n=1 Tax=Sphagnurus paluster TaxID=117069 RepID=A0A9P7KGS0_9AGAR|nr:hypothetical protein H0H81_001800 [Sphagnurus paluster]
MLSIQFFSQFLTPMLLLVDRSWEDAPVALWTFIATSAGLIIAAIVQRDQLTLFQALQVANLVWLANFGTFFALASYSRQKATSPKARRAFDYKVKFGAMVQALVSMALSLYMWHVANAKTFGNLSECSSLIKYMFFAIEAHATGAGRIAGLIMTTILTTAYIVVTLQELRTYYQNRFKTQTMKRLPISVPMRSSSFFVESLHSGNASTHQPVAFRLYDHTIAPPPCLPPLNYSTRSASRRPKRRRWSSDLDPMLVGIIICQAIVFTYFVVSTELLLRRNPSNDHEERKWSFGQILALIVVIPSALSLSTALSEHGVRRLPDQRKSTLKDERRRRHRVPKETA